MNYKLYVLQIILIEFGGVHLINKTRKSFVIYLTKKRHSKYIF